MKKLLFIALIINSVSLTKAQVIVDPYCFDDQTEITLYYDASKGSSGLVGASKVYMHSGVITDSPTGTNWQNVIGNWGEDDGVGQMTKVTGESNLWKISLTPRTYYNVSEGISIYRLSMVFRNQDGSAEGKNDQNGDIFINLSDGSLNLQLASPVPVLVDQNDVVSINASTCSAADFTLFVNDVEETTQSTTSNFSYDYTVTQNSGEIVEMRIEAIGGSEPENQEFSFSVRTPTVTEPRPAGIFDGINYNEADPTRVTLSLLAPMKSSVYVLGDFNNWQTNADYQMKKDGERFWLEISGLTPGKEYVFQYLIDETIRIADPYTDKVSDPFDDQYIDNATYPNLIPYPKGKTSNRASVLQTDQEPYVWKNTSFTRLPKEDLVIYELLIRDFDERHSYKAVMDRLDYLEDLGVNAIEFMPTNEFEGNISWGYNPNFYFAPDKYYGHKNDFKALIDECHNRGIAVIIDLVLNHSYGSSPMVRMYWNNSQNRPSEDNPWFNEQSNFENPEAQWGYDFNHESQYTKDFIDSVNTYWMEEYKVDGFRFDFTKGFSNNFKSNATDSWGSLYDADRIANLKRMTDVIWDYSQDAYVILEHLSVNSEETELANYGMMLWANHMYDYNEAAMGYASGKSIGGAYYENRGWNENGLTAYMESHDEERQMFKLKEYGNSAGTYNTKELHTALQRLKLTATFFFTVPGPKMIWQFGEFGYDISIDENGRTGVKPTKWEYLDDIRRQNLVEVYKELIGLRDKYDIFTEGDFSWQPGGNFKSIHITKGDTNVVIVGNFDVNTGELNPQFQHTGTWYDFFSGNEIEVTNTAEPITLGAGVFHIYTDKRLHQPDYDIITGFEDEIANSQLSLFPNPAQHVITLHSNWNVSRTTQWEIRNVLGQVEATGFISGQETTINIDQFQEGLYIISVSDGLQQEVLKFLKE